MTQSAVQDYAKAIYALEQREHSAPSRPTRSPSGSASPPPRPRGWSSGSTASAWSTHVPYRGRAADRRGTQVALEVLRHHRLLELYLAEALGVPWDRVHDEAEVLEHVLSEELEELIAAKLGDPTHDPHGDPIPTRDLRDRRDADTVALDGSRASATAARFVRVSDSDPEMLRYLAERGIAPGDELRGRRQAAVRRPAVRALRRPDVHALGGALAGAMRVAGGA